jgi:hypothetical protein
MLNNTELSYHSPCFFVELKPAPNNKDIFNVEFIQQCKIKFKLPKYKSHIAQCANCQRYGYTKNYCHLKLKYVKCEGDQLTNQCQRKERFSYVRCALCAGNSANYEGCTVYKDLQMKTYPLLHSQLYTPPAQIKWIQVDRRHIHYTKRNVRPPPPQSK